jgi:predicted N-acetyltransferase YhbS
MIIQNERGLNPYIESLDALYVACFGGLRFAAAPRADWRSILIQDGALVAHAALQERVFELPDVTLKGCILGLVGVQPTHRGQNLGLLAVREVLGCVHAPVVLNCGQSLTTYYGKLGFRALSPQASYERNGEIEIDPDPVMVWNEAAYSLAKQYAVVHLGTNF